MTQMNEDQLMTKLDEWQKEPRIFVTAGSIAKVSEVDYASGIS